jgi:hypothetical protein
MVRKVFGAALALGMLFGSSLAQAQTPAIGQTAPPFSLSTPRWEAAEHVQLYKKRTSRTCRSARISRLPMSLLCAAGA